MSRFPDKIRKRDDSLVSFDNQKITRAIYNAALETIENESQAREISTRIGAKVLEKIAALYQDAIPSD